MADPFLRQGRLEVRPLHRQEERFFAPQTPLRMTGVVLGGELEAKTLGLRSFGRTRRALRMTNGKPGRFLPASGQDRGWGTRGRSRAGIKASTTSEQDAARADLILVSAQRKHRAKVVLTYRIKWYKFAYFAKSSLRLRIQPNENNRRDKCAASLASQGSLFFCA